MTDATDIAIIGGGVIGLSIGWELLRRGRSVTIFERDAIGAGASRAAAGMLAPRAELDFEEGELLDLGVESLARYPGFVDRLEAATGQSVDFRTDETIVVAVDRDDAEALDHIHSYQTDLGLEVERIGADRARELEPGLAPKIHSALLCQEDHQVDPVRLVDALGAAFEAAGGQLREGTAVEAVRRREGRIDGLVTESGEAVDAQVVVVAAGAWAPDIEGIPSGIMPHIRPVRGQMLACDLGDPPICRRVIRVPDPSQMDVYLVPKSDGRLLVGATSEERGFDPHLTAGGVFELLRGAYKALPGIYDRNILDMWTGFRPVTLTGQPVVGPTQVEGLWLAVGHGRGGILMTPLTAEIVAESICADTPADELDLFTRPSQSR